MLFRWVLYPVFIVSGMPVISCVFNRDSGQCKSDYCRWSCKSTTASDCDLEWCDDFCCCYAYSEVSPDPLASPTCARKDRKKDKWLKEDEKKKESQVEMCCTVLSQITCSQLLHTNYMAVSNIVHWITKAMQSDLNTFELFEIPSVKMFQILAEKNGLHN